MKRRPPKDDRGPFYDGDGREIERFRVGVRVRTEKFKLGNHSRFCTLEACDEKRCRFGQEIPIEFTLTVQRLEGPPDRAKARARAILRDLFGRSCRYRTTSIRRDHVAERQIARGWAAG
jgi:hypothetical protein